ncbi:MAG TPA: hypothetical protein EYQ74_03655 [Planctomycetes bacterium]|nr:hypothetical protein [Planctomycetota bacterium]HIK59618.1 hypothetical protein [Planctomycetota bacterium]
MSEDKDLLQGRVHKLEGLLEALELEVERAHALMDQWDLPREVTGEDGRPLELSLAGRLERLPESD